MMALFPRKNEGAMKAAKKEERGRMPRVIFFDLEGPLSPQDNAYELMRRVLGDERGAAIFEIISKYDDIISMEGRENYEPGDTLALIIPFLLVHGVTAADIKKVSDSASLVSGARYLCDVLRSRGWKIYIISTSYEQHALNIGIRLGVNPENIVCTRPDLNQDASFMGDLIEEVEREILELYNQMHQMPLEDDESLMKTDVFNTLRMRLDTLFFEELPEMGYDVFGVRVIGGGRKAEALKEIVERENADMSDVIAVGDSITDAKMLDFVRRSGDGLSVVFNGNEYAVPHASAGLASTDIRFLLILCDAFEHGGKDEALMTASMWEAHGDEWVRRFKRCERIPESAHISSLSDFLKDAPLFFLHNIEHADERKMNEILQTHKIFRRIVREDAGKLG